MWTSVSVSDTLVSRDGHDSLIRPVSRLSPYSVLPDVCILRVPSIPEGKDGTPVGAVGRDRRDRPDRENPTSTVNDGGLGARPRR